MGELASLAHEATALTNRLGAIEKLLNGADPSTRLARSDWRSKNGADGYLFGSRALHGRNVVPKRSLLTRINSPLDDIFGKYSPDQARDERGRWTAGGGSGSTSISASTAIDAIRASADNLARTRTFAAAERFLQVTKDTLNYVGEGLYEDDVSFWKRLFVVIGEVFHLAATASDAIGLGVAAGVGVGSAVGASAGVATAIALAGWLAHEKWSQQRDYRRSKREIKATRARINGLEDEIERLRRRRRK